GDGGERDVGEQVAAEAPKTHQAEHEDGHAQHDRENRAANRDGGEAHFFACAGVEGAALGAAPGESTTRGSAGGSAAARSAGAGGATCTTSLALSSGMGASTTRSLLDKPLRTSRSPSGAIAKAMWRASRREAA